MHHCAICRAEITQQESFFVCFGSHYESCCEACYAVVQRLRKEQQNTEHKGCGSVKCEICLGDARIETVGL